MEERGLVQMKGKGAVNTYWLVGATEKAIQKREVCISLNISGTQAKLCLSVHLPTCCINRF